MSLGIALALYAAFAVFVAGLAWRIANWLRTPARLCIAVTPAPRRRAGVIWRIAKEVMAFASLFGSNKWLWFFGWLFHASLFVLLLRHLRYFLQPVPAWVALVQPLGVPAGLAMVFALIGLLLRRMVLPRVRYVTTASDQLILLLLALIAVSGLVMSLVKHPDIIALKQFILGLYVFRFSELPADAPLVMHLLMIAFLFALFPLSKLLHAPGIFFAPSRVQKDAGRDEPVPASGV